MGKTLMFELVYLKQQKVELDNIDSTPFYREQLERYKDTVYKLELKIKEFEELIKALSEKDL